MITWAILSLALPSQPGGGVDARALVPSILAVVSGLTLAGASAVSHDIYASVMRKGAARSEDELRDRVHTIQDRTYQLRNIALDATLQLTRGIGEAAKKDSTAAPERGISTDDLLAVTSPTANANAPASLPGAHFDVVIDRTHWLTQGYERPRLTVLLEGSTFYKLSRAGSNVGVFAPTGTLTRGGFTWPGNTERLLRNTAFLIQEPVGGGHLVAFANEPMFLPDLGADFFIAGTHKWLTGPRGTGLIWGRKDAGPFVHATIPTFDPIWRPPPRGGRWSARPRKSRPRGASG